MQLLVEIPDKIQKALEAQDGSFGRITNIYELCGYLMNGTILDHCDTCKYKEEHEDGFHCRHCIIVRSMYEEDQDAVSN